MKGKISVVVPIFNEESGIVKFLDLQLMPVLQTLECSYEVILVDDGSRDRSIERIHETGLIKNGKAKLVALSRNFGKEIALTAGIREASGDAVILIDADGQHPVKAIPEMVQRWQNGARIVTAVRDENTTKHKLGSRIYYRLTKMLGNRDVVVGAMDFRLIDREVVDEFNKMNERNRLTRGLIDWLGYPQEYVNVKTGGRISGRPTYSFKKLVGITIDGLASSSRTPLVIFGWIGFFITFVSLILGLFILIQQYIMGDPMGLDWSGAVAISVFVAFLVGLVLISQAITALYISQIHQEAKGRPLYVIDKKKSFGINDER